MNKDKKTNDRILESGTKSLPPVKDKVEPPKMVPPKKDDNS